MRRRQGKDACGTEAGASQRRTADAPVDPVLGWFSLEVLLPLSEPALHTLDSRTLLPEIPPELGSGSTTQQAKATHMAGD
jgi:hypothetical protein